MQLIMTLKQIELKVIKPFKVGERIRDSVVGEESFI